MSTFLILVVIACSRLGVFILQRKGRSDLFFRFSGMIAPLMLLQGGVILGERIDWLIASLCLVYFPFIKERGDL